jgi:hypothetical protein
MLSISIGEDWVIKNCAISFAAWIDEMCRLMMWFLRFHQVACNNDVANVKTIQLWRTSSPKDLCNLTIECKPIIQTINHLFLYSFSFVPCARCRKLSSFDRVTDFFPFQRWIEKSFSCSWLLYFQIVIIGFNLRLFDYVILRPFSPMLLLIQERIKVTSHKYS